MADLDVALTGTHRFAAGVNEREPRFAAEGERLGKLRTPLKNTPACRVTLTRPLVRVNTASPVAERGRPTWHRTECRNRGSGPSVSMIETAGASLARIISSSRFIVGNLAKSCLSRPT
jgi:hypothetical protein